ncbi:MAG: ABC transporter ATP-binding protein [Propionibacteriaceae bacterium]|nr:ABC transporter ATP-binding protein [Propionibacteriaceae bacterium]
MTGRNSFTDLRDQLAQESIAEAPEPLSPPPPPPSPEPSVVEPEVSGATVPRPTRSGSSSRSSKTPAETPSRIAELRRNLAAGSAAGSPDAEQEPAAGAETPEASRSRFFHDGLAAEPPAPAAPTPPSASRPSTMRSRAASASTSTDDRIAALRRDLAIRRAAATGAAEPAADQEPVAAPPVAPEPTPRPRTGRTLPGQSKVASTASSAASSPSSAPAAPPVRERRPISRPVPPVVVPPEPAPRPAAIITEVPMAEPVEEQLPEPEVLEPHDVVVEPEPLPAPEPVLEEALAPEELVPAAPEPVEEPVEVKETTKRRTPPKTTPAPAAPSAPAADLKPKPVVDRKPQPVAPAIKATDADIAVVSQLTKVYTTSTVKVNALRGVSLAFKSGCLTAIMGRSGSGKSTLLHCMAGLDSATTGTVTVAGKNLSGMKEQDLTKFRRESVGFIFQTFNLMPGLTVAENIQLPLAIQKKTAEEGWYDQVVSTLGLTELVARQPVELSSGQQQRVACARALITKPVVVFADEPTGNLDSESAAEVLTLLKTCVSTLGQSVIMATHDPLAAAYADRVCVLDDGVVSQEISSPNLNRVVDVFRSMSGSRSLS